MLRVALNENLLTKKSVLQYMGSRFRIIAQSMAPWKSDSEVGEYIYR